MPFFSTQKVGGLRFVRIGRLCLSFCVTRKPKPQGEYLRNRDGSLILENGKPIFCRYSAKPARKRKVKLPRANWQAIHIPSPSAIDSQLLAVESALFEAEAILAEAHL